MNEAYCLHNYRHLVGAINYLCTCTRVDIALAMSKLSRHLKEPSPTDAKHLYQLVRYLATRRSDGILFGRNLAHWTSTRGLL